MVSMSDTENMAAGAYPAPSRLPWFLFAGALALAIVAGVFGVSAWHHDGVASAALDGALKRAKDAEDAKAALDLKVSELSANLESTEAELAKLKATSDSLA